MRWPPKAIARLGASKAQDPSGEATRIRIGAEQIRQLYERLPTGISMSLLVATLLAAALTATIDWRRSLAWWLLVALVSAARLLIARRYRRAAPAPPQAQRWGDIFYRSTWAAGVAWGSASFVIFPGEPVGRMLLTITAAGVTSGGITTLASSWRSVFAFLVLALMPLIVRYATLGGGEHLAVAGMILLYLFLLLASARRTYESILQALQLQEHIVAQGAALERSEARYRSLVENAPVGVFRCSASDGLTLQMTNPRLNRMLGLPAEAPPRGTALRDLFSEESDYEDFEDRLRTRGQVTGMVHRVKTGDGRRLWAAINARLVRDGRGAVDHVAGTLRDITAQRRSREALQRAKEETDRVNRRLEVAIAEARQLARDAESASIAKGEFLANMSHEIRTPLNGVIGMTALLLDTELAPAQRTYAETVQRSAESLLAVINDVLDVSKIESGRLELEEEDFDLRTMLEDVTDLAAMHVRDKDLDVACLVDPAVPEQMRGDAARLRQILTNLLANGVKFTEHGEVVMRVALAGTPEPRRPEEGEPGDVEVRFEVRDTGIGIPPDRIEHLFDAFTQADASTTRRYGGTGLGLSIAKQLAELMGGRIGAENRPSGGSTFWFTARLRPRQGAPVADPAPASLLEGLRVLAVDPHRASRDVLDRMLRDSGGRPDVVGDPKEALARLESAAAEGDPFRIAILDTPSSPPDGESPGSSLASRPAPGDTALVMMTSLPLRGAPDRLEQGGFAAYLTKPVRRAQLESCLLTALGHGTAEVPKETETVPPRAKPESPVPPPRILVAEDNRVNREVALRMLEKLGYEADAVGNGREAVEALTDRPYALVLMDVQMPELDGLEATRRIREGAAGPRRSGVPILALTAHALAEDREACIAAGMNDYLAKPVVPERLGAVLASWLSSDP